MSWTRELRKRQAEYPNEIFVRFVARHWYDEPDRMKIDFLDLGSGAGANSNYLDEQGFNVVAVDSSRAANADLYCPIEKLEFPEGRFDCILDHNTLCHIENPPLDKIRDWLKPNGIFFSMCPTAYTWRGHLMGKGFCRMLTHDQALNFYKGFSELRIAHSEYPDRGNQIPSWVVEGSK